MAVDCKNSQSAAYACKLKMFKFTLKVIKKIQRNILNKVRLKTLSSKVVFFVSFMVILTVVLAYVNFGKIISDLSETNEKRKAVTIAGAVSIMPEVIKDVEKNVLEQQNVGLIEKLLVKSGADFMVIQSDRSFIYPDKINSDTKQFFEKNILPMKYGKYFEISGKIGDKKYFIGQSPVYSKEGKIKGQVSIAFASVSFRNMVSDYSKKLFLFVYVIISFTIIMSIMISGKIKKSLLGYEPKELSMLFLEKDTVINSVREAIVAVDNELKIRIYNKIASSYFGRASSDIPAKIIEIMKSSISRGNSLYDPSSQ